MKKYVLASGNKHKLEEISKIVKAFDIELLTMDDVNLSDLEIIEDADTFEGNSFIKAKTVSDITKMPVIADDSGLMVDYLDGAPGVYSARYAGENADYNDNNKKLLLELDGVDKANRGAKFVTVITLLFPNGDKIVARGEVKGKISESLRGDKGFGYDPLFIVDEKGVTYAEMDSSLKNEISHRAKAMNKLKESLKEYFISK